MNYVAAPEPQQRPRPQAASEYQKPAPSFNEPRVKICGITSLQDAQFAVEAGAWAVGMIFWPESKRRCDFDTAQLIGHELKRQVEIVGVFVDATLDEIAHHVDACNLTIVQLHGAEGPSYCDEVYRRTGAKVIKAARVKIAADVEALRLFRSDFHLLDTYVEGVQGGTGEVFDWELTKAARANPGARPPRMILSGGLNARNVSDAIVATKPFAVDVSSGVEESPGVKNHQKITAFMEAAADGWERKRPPREENPVEEPVAPTYAERRAAASGEESVTAEAAVHQRPIAPAPQVEQPSPEAAQKVPAAQLEQQHHEAGPDVQPAEVEQSSPEVVQPPPEVEQPAPEAPAEPVVVDLDGQLSLLVEEPAQNASQA